MTIITTSLPYSFCTVSASKSLLLSSILQPAIFLIGQPFFFSDSRCGFLILVKRTLWGGFDPTRTSRRAAFRDMDSRICGMQHQRGENHSNYGLLGVKANSRLIPGMSAIVWNTCLGYEDRKTSTQKGSGRSTTTISKRLRGFGSCGLLRMLGIHALRIKSKKKEKSAEFGHQQYHVVAKFPSDNY